MTCRPCGPECQRLAASWLRDIEEPEPRIIQWLVGEREEDQ